MAGVAASMTTLGLDDAIQRLGRVAGFDMAGLAADASAILESSTRGRFQSKASPDGEGWAAWSDDYAETRGAQHSLLVGENDLLDSIASYATGDEAEVGSNLVYAAIHQFGGEEVDIPIPARPYLGVSVEDTQDLSALVTGRLSEVLL